MASLLTLDPDVANSAVATAFAGRRIPAGGHPKAHAAAQDFEAVFLNSMFQQMFTGVDGEGPMGGSGAVGIWRSFLTDQYAKSFAQKGGIGLADHVYRALIERQAAASQTARTPEQPS
jgi:peptidoglycan hydrolase FlgJ